MRLWHLEPYLIERILPVLERDPRLRRIPLPDPAPDLRIFEHLLGEDEIARAQLEAAAARAPRFPLGAMATRAAAPESPTLPGRVALHPNIIARLRGQDRRQAARATRTGAVPHLALVAMAIPGGIARRTSSSVSTQDCGQPGTVILDEGYGETRWNIDHHYDVTLEANGKACCLADGDDDPEGICALITDVCDSPINVIGGNPGAPAAPVGYLSPGAALYPAAVTNYQATAPMAGGADPGTGGLPRWTTTSSSCPPTTE